MSLTRRMLKGMGLTEEQADTIIEAHTEVTDGLKDKLKVAEDKVSDYDAIQKKLEEEYRRRIAAMADSGGKVNLSKQKPMGDDEEGDEDSYFSNIQHLAR